MAVEVKQNVNSAPAVSAAPEKPKKAKVAKSKPTHPTWATMIEVAVKAMNEKGGSSIQAIKKFILDNNQTVDTTRLTSLMRRAVKTLTDNGTLIQAKGHGLTGSFKLGTGMSKGKAPKKASTVAVEKKNNLPKKEAEVTEIKKTVPVPVKTTRESRMVAKSDAPKKVKEDSVKAKKPATKKMAPVAAVKKLAPAEKPKAEKKAPSKPKVEEKAPSKPKAEEKAPSKPKAEKKTLSKPKVNRLATKPKSSKSKTIKKVAAKPKAKAAAPK